MDPKIKIFETGRDEGIVSRNAKFYDEQCSQEEIDQIFLKTRLEIGKKYGFDGHKMFQAQQKNAINKLDYPDGKYIILTKDHMTKEDFWYESLPTDILMITEEYPNVVVGHQMADCPILIAEDRAKGVTALAHCGASYIDRGLPKDTIQALKEAFQSNPYDIYVYIGSCAGKETYIYQTYPTWALHQELWNKHITQEQDGYHIDLVGAIQQQLKEEGITHIETSAIDTIKDPKFYSHKASIEGNNSKKGQNFVGFFYK